MLFLWVKGLGDTTFWWCLVTKCFDQLIETCRFWLFLPWSSKQSTINKLIHGSPSLRVIWVFGTESYRGGDETLGGVSGDLDHDAAGDVLVNTGPGHQIQKGAEKEEDEDNFDNWKYSSHKWWWGNGCVNVSDCSLLTQAIIYSPGTGIQRIHGSRGRLMGKRKIYTDWTKITQVCNQVARMKKMIK